MKPVLATAAAGSENQDRGLVIDGGARLVLCVADGAGGRGGAKEAAAAATEFLSQHASRLHSAEACVELLRQLDKAVAKDPAAGETTCALAVVAPEVVFGASVGDSAVWLIPQSEGHLDLTSGQQRKPLIGSGDAWPVAFRRPRPGGTLLLATDGLLKYSSAERILTVCREHPPHRAAQRLIELVRYPSGALPDDVTVILAQP